MGEVKRLPVQHRQKPHCPKCSAPLPTLNMGLHLEADATVECEILGVELHLRCKCGAECLLQLTKTKGDKNG